MSTYEALTSILTQRFEVAENDIVPDSAFEELGMDSLFLVEFLMVVEQDLGVEVGDEAITPASSLNQLTELVDQQRVEKTQSA